MLRRWFFTDSPILAVLAGVVYLNWQGFQSIMDRRISMDFDGFLCNHFLRGSSHLVSGNWGMILQALNKLQDQNQQ